MLDDALHLAYLALHLKVSELPDAVVADVDDDHVAAPLPLLLPLTFQVLHHSQPRRPLHLAPVRVYRRIELATLVPDVKIQWRSMLQDDTFLNRHNCSLNVSSLSSPEHLYEGPSLLRPGRHQETLGVAAQPAVPAALAALADLADIDAVGGEDLDPRVGDDVLARGRHAHRRDVFETGGRCLVV